MKSHYRHDTVAETELEDDFFCLDQKCRDRQAARRKERKARQARRKRRRHYRQKTAAKRRREYQEMVKARRNIRTAKQKARLEKMKLKNDALRSETAQRRAETNILVNAARRRSPMAPPAATTAAPLIQQATLPRPPLPVKQKMPPWVLYAGGAALLVTLVLVTQSPKAPRR